MAKLSSLNAALMSILGALRSTVVTLDPTLQIATRSSLPVFTLDDVERSGFLEQSPFDISDYL